MNLSEIFIYEQESGRLLWRTTHGKVKAGMEAGWHSTDGYRRLFCSGKTRLAHRLIWDLNNPDDKLSPEDDIDHINHIRNDNRMANLRKVSRAENNKNLTKSYLNRSGTLGVYWAKHRNKWTAQIKVNGKQVYLGRYESLQEAIDARKAAEVKFGFHENHGEDCNA